MPHYWCQSPLLVVIHDLGKSNPEFVKEYSIPAEFCYSDPGLFIWVHCPSDIGGVRNPT